MITPLLIFLAQYWDEDSSASGRDPASSVISLLPMIYVVIAAGVALTKHRYVTLTTTRIRHASRLMSSSEPERAAGTIAICLLLASIGAHHCLAAASAILVAMNWYLVNYAVAPRIWSGTISVAVATFERPHAARRVLIFDRPDCLHRRLSDTLLPNGT